MRIQFAHKSNMSANIEEYIVETPDRKKVWLTVVGDEGAASAYGIDRGWYVAVVLSEDDATFMVNALAEFTKIHEP